MHWHNAVRSWGRTSLSSDHAGIGDKGKVNHDTEGHQCNPLSLPGSPLHSWSAMQITSAERMDYPYTEDGSFVRKAPRATIHDSVIKQRSKPYFRATNRHDKSPSPLPSRAPAEEHSHPSTATADNTQEKSPSPTTISIPNDDIVSLQENRALLPQDTPQVNEGSCPLSPASVSASTTLDKATIQV